MILVSCGKCPGAAKAVTSFPLGLGAVGFSSIGDVNVETPIWLLVSVAGDGGNLNSIGDNGGRRAGVRGGSIDRLGL